jgi:photosystem II stability/assembly factor-like uncharacterized protein
MTTIYKSDFVSAWLQRDCFDELEFLGCTDVTDLDLTPRGELSASRQRIGKGQFRIESVRRNAADFGSVTFTFYRGIVDLLNDLPCPPNIILMYSNCGADDDPDNYDFADVLQNVYPGTATQAAIVNAIGPDDATDVGADIVVELPAQFLSNYTLKQLIDTPITISALSAHDIVGVAICDPDPNCGDCDDLTVGCQTIWVITDGVPGSAADVSEIYKSTNGGTTWTQITNNMTDNTDDLSDIECSGDTVIVSNGTTAEYLYATDGSTFNLVTTPTQIISDVFILGPTKIWMAAAGGYVYFSSNRGQSVSTQDAGVATSENLNSISFADSLLGYAVGANNAFIYTEDGQSWQVGTGPAAATVLNVVLAVPNTDALFVGDANGVVYRSEDKGVTWATVYAATTSTAGGIADITLCACNVPTFIANSAGDAAGVVIRSIDGGNTWETPSIPSGNTGLEAIACCDVNTYWVVGDVGEVFKLAGQSFRDTAS